MTVRDRILHAIADRGEAFGMQLVHALDAKIGTVYPTLERLRAAGLVVSREETRPPKPCGACGEFRARRRYYRLTEAGFVQIGRIYVHVHE